MEEERRGELLAGEKKGRVADYAGLVARAVLEETMSERIWSIPCSADCHSQNTSSSPRLGVVPQRSGGGALCWTPESSCTNLQHKPEFQAHCCQYRGEGKAGEPPALVPGRTGGTGKPSEDNTSSDQPQLAAGQENSHIMAAIPTRSSPSSPGSRTETDVVHYRLSGHSRDSLHLPERWAAPAMADQREESTEGGCGEENAGQPVPALSIRNNKSVENLSCTPHLLTNGNGPCLRKGLSVNDITRVSSSNYHGAEVNGGDANSGVTAAAATTHKSPSRLQLFRQLGRKKSNRDEVTVRTVTALPAEGMGVSSLVKIEEMGRAQRKGGRGGGCLRKTITNIFHLKPPARCPGNSCEPGPEENGGESRRKHNVGGGGGGGLMSRLTKRHKTVPPGKRALPPVPPPPPRLPSCHPAVPTSRTPSPHQQLTSATTDRVPSPAAASLDAVEWMEPAGLTPDYSPELAVTTASGSPSPGAVQSQKDFAASIEKVKDHGWYWGPLSGEAAERILAKEPDGSFVVRDSSDHHHIFSLTFKLNGFVRHVRIEHDQGNFSFGSFTKFKSNTIVDFIENAVEHSRSGRYLFFLHRRPVLGPMRVQLLHPVSRFKRVQSLQHLCRYVIVKHVRKDHLEELPVPNRIKTYLNTPFYYSEQIEAEAENDQFLLGLESATEPLVPDADWHSAVSESLDVSADLPPSPLHGDHTDQQTQELGEETLQTVNIHNPGHSLGAIDESQAAMPPPPLARVPNGCAVIEDQTEEPS